SDCVLLYSWADVVSHRAMQGSIEDPAARLAARRSSVAAFDLAEASGCRWRNLVRHFDEAIEPCGAACDVCRNTDIADLVRPAAAGLRGGSAPAGVEGVVNGEPCGRLRPLRRRLAAREGVPAYVVFSDAVLARMVAMRPTDEAGLLTVSGVGPTKLQRYGAAFLRVLREG